MNFLTIVFFAGTAGLNATAQLFLKKASLSLASTIAGNDPLLTKFLKTIVNPFVFFAVIFLGLGILLWMKILSRMELSSAYPINVALTVIITAIASVFLFQESITIVKFMGIALVIAGLWGILVG